MKTVKDRPYLSVSEAAEEAGVSVYVVRQLVKSGTLPSYRFGSQSKIYVRLSELLACAQPVALPDDPEQAEIDRVLDAIDREFRQPTRH